MKRIAILQSNYIPWKGYFDLINSVDEFIFYDDMQYTRRDWRNRNRIYTPNGLRWLSIPVEVKGRYYQKINETVVSDPDWGKRHWETIRHNYAKAPFFREYRDRFEMLYLECDERLLSQINRRFIESINDILGIDTKLRSSEEFTLHPERTQRLVNICLECNATHYLSGPAAKDYLDVKRFNAVGIEVEWMEYDGYPIYSQLYTPFQHGVTVLDLLFNTGPNAKKYMKSFSL